MYEKDKVLEQRGGGQRNSSISLIRLISLLMIITCHIMQWLGLELAWWFNIGVQIFLCISGWLYGQRDVSEITIFYNRRFKKILLPYFIVFISCGIIQFLFVRSVFKSTIFIKGLFINATLTGGEHLWFISTILLCYILTPLLQAYRNKYVKDQKNLLLFFVGAVIIIYIFFGAFNELYNPAWINCYIIGYLLGVNDNRNYINVKILIALIGIITIMCNGIQIYCSYIIYRNFQGYQYFCNYNHVTLGVFLFLTMKVLFDRMNLVKLDKILTITDLYSYEIYLVHQFIILGPFSLMAFTEILPINILIIFVGVIVLAWILKNMEEVVEYVILYFVGNNKNITGM